MAKSGLMEYRVRSVVSPEEIEEKIGRVLTEGERRLAGRLLDGFDVDPETLCWIWRWGKTAEGYGAFKVRGLLTYVHRAMQELYNGPIPEGYVVHHLCGNRPCGNPAHLEPRTRRDNAREGVHVKLTMEKAEEIRARLRALADEYGITVGTLTTFARRDGSWR